MERRDQLQSLAPEYLGHEVVRHIVVQRRDRAGRHEPEKQPIRRRALQPVGQGAEVGA
jgi:hypothetical protein